jgi:hypothetical protein
MVIPFGNQHFSNDTKGSLHVQHQIESKPAAKAATTSTLALGSNQFLSLVPEDCEPSVELEDLEREEWEWKESPSMVQN